jgi:Lrp/AsnC family leucine-responsive transcriptional regulator
MKENITSADAIILNLLQKDAKLGLDVLAYETGLSVASVQRRLKSLRSRKLILGDVAIVDPVKVGLPMTFIVLVELERERIDQIDAFMNPWFNNVIT